ncbi:MAG: glutathione S-transferase family protein [Micavibrio sp.]
MSYELYTKAGSCSMAVHAVMNELELNPEIHLMEQGAQGLKSPEYLKINPRGNVPCLVEDGKVMIEGGAIIAYLCDKVGKLIPQKGFERAQALQWLMFCNATLHPAYGRTFWISANLPQEQQEAALKAARAQIQQLWDYVEGELEKSGSDYLCGAEPSAGDFLLTTIANWNPAAYQFGPKTKAILKNISARPSYQKALAAESIEYKAAA